MSNDTAIPLPEPDGPDVGYYVTQSLIDYAAACVAVERERWANHLRDLAAGHQRAAEMTYDHAAEQRHDAMAAALLEAIRAGEQR